MPCIDALSKLAGQHPGGSDRGHRFSGLHVFPHSFLPLISEDTRPGDGFDALVVQLVEEVIVEDVIIRNGLQVAQRLAHDVLQQPFHFRQGL